MVRLCSRLTWLLALPCLARVAGAGADLPRRPQRVVDRPTRRSPPSGVAKLVMGWPLQVASLAAMVWLLARNHTPLEPGAPEPDLGHPPEVQA